MYTQSTAQIPGWVHEFRQWHVDMFATLTEPQQSHVHLSGSWIVFPYGEYDRLDPGFLVPLEPLMVPLHPSLREFVEQVSSTVWDRVGDYSIVRELQSIPSSSTMPVTRSQTRASLSGK